MNKITRFVKFSSRRKYLLFATFVLSIVSYILMKFFKTWASFETQKTPSNFAVENMDIVRDIRYAIKFTAKYTSWQNVCRHQAYQAKVLCNSYKIPYKIYVGFKKNEAGLIEGHAWTVVYGKIITGFCNPQDYTVQAIYSNEQTIP